jgi:hypothetical protein
MANRVRLSCTTSPQISEAIEQLLWSGLYGNSRAQVVERLIADAVVAKIRERVIKVEDLKPETKA